MKKNLINKLRESIKENRRSENLFLVGDYAVAKKGYKEQITNEYNIGRYLHQKNIQVPETHCCVKPDLFLFKSAHEIIIKDWYVITKKIDGINIMDVPEHAKEKAMNLYKTELEKVLELGICPYDSDFGGNAMFGEDGKVYLIDFEMWKKGWPVQISQFRKQVINNPNFEFRVGRSDFEVRVGKWN